MRERLDALGAEAAELVAHHVERLVAQGDVAEIAAGEHITQELGDAGADGLGVAETGERRDIGGAEAREIVLLEGEIGGAQDLGLAQRNAARELREIFAEGHLQHEGFELAELAGCAEMLGPAVHLAQGFDVGRHPGIAVDGELAGFQAGCVDRAAGGDLRGDAAFRCGEQGLRGIERAGGEREKVGEKGRGVGLAHKDLVFHRAPIFCLVPISQPLSPALAGGEGRVRGCLRVTIGAERAERPSHPYPLPHFVGRGEI